MGPFGRKKKHESVRFGGHPNGTRPECKEERTFSLAELEIFETLGKGTFGRVRLVRHIDDGGYYALKIVKKKYVWAVDHLEHLKREVRLLQLINHPFIVKLHSYFQDELRMYILLEFVAGGELYAHLLRSTTFPNHQAMFYSAQATLALEYLHAMDVVYRGLRPENVLLDRDGNIKFVDFGFAKVVPKQTYTLCGAPDYVAPEVLLDLGYGKSVDWWALGVLTYEMLVGHPPFFDSTPFGTYEKIMRGKVDLPRLLDTKVKRLIRGLLDVDRTKRLGCRTGAFRCNPP